MFIIKYKKIFISISILLVLASLVSLFVFGFKIGVDFKGGSLTEVTYLETRPDKFELDNELALLNFGNILLQPAGDLSYLVKTRDLTEVEHLNLLNVLSKNGKYALEENNFNSIGPSVGKELTRKAIVATILVSFAILCFIAFAFRKVSKPVSSWRYGIIAVISLLHDVIIAAGLFSLLSYFKGVEIDSLFVVAILTILGLSVSDTIVVFDRVRENLKNRLNESFSEVVSKSLNQSYLRSIFTSLTGILVLISLIILGPASTKYFALTLAFGLFFGTYSSVCLASPLLVLTEEWQKKKNK